MMLLYSSFHLYHFNSNSELAGAGQEMPRHLGCPQAPQLAGPDTLLLPLWLSPRKYFRYIWKYNENTWHRHHVKCQWGPGGSGTHWVGGLWGGEGCFALCSWLLSLLLRRSPLFLLSHPTIPGSLCITHWNLYSSNIHLILFYSGNYYINNCIVIGNIF